MALFLSCLARAHVKENAKMVGTVVTTRPNEPVSLMYQGIELFPLNHLLSGNKVGTVGTKRPCIGVVPTYSHDILTLVGTEKPSNGRVSGQCSLVPTVPTIFFIYRV